MTRTWKSEGSLVAEVWRGLPAARSSRRAAAAAERVREIRSLRVTYVKQHMQLFAATNGRMPSPSEYAVLWDMACADVDKRGS